MHSSGSRWRLLLVLLAALALACRGEVDPITGQQSPTTGYPKYEPVRGQAAKDAKTSQRRDKMSGRSQAQKGRKRMMAAMFGDDGDGGPKAGCVLTNVRPAPKRPAPRQPHTAVATLAHHRSSSGCRMIELPKLALFETLIGVFVIMALGVLFSGAV